MPEDGISDAIVYVSRKKYAGLMPLEMRRLRQFKQDNAKLKRLIADRNFYKAMLPDATV